MIFPHERGKLATFRGLCLLKWLFSLLACCSWIITKDKEQENLWKKTHEKRPRKHTHTHNTKEKRPRKKKQGSTTNLSRIFLWPKDWGTKKTKEWKINRGQTIRVLRLVCLRPWGKPPFSPLIYVLREDVWFCHAFPASAVSWTNLPQLQMCPTPLTGCDAPPVHAWNWWYLSFWLFPFYSLFGLWFGKSPLNRTVFFSTRLSQL